MILPVFSLWSCSPRGSANSAAGTAEESGLATECSSQLIYLANLIEVKEIERDFPASALIEAKELYELGEELYLKRDFRLALDLIEEALQLLQETSD
jgi:hypothetical protein